MPPSLSVMSVFQERKQFIQKWPESQLFPCYLRDDDGHPVKGEKRQRHEKKRKDVLSRRDDCRRHHDSQKSDPPFVLKQLRGENPQLRQEKNGKRPFKNNPACQEDGEGKGEVLANGNNGG